MCNETDAGKGLVRVLSDHRGVGAMGFVFAE